MGSAEAAAILRQQQEADMVDQHPPQHTADLQQQRIEYATHMRCMFSPPGMLQPDGSIEQAFFKPKTVVTLTDK
jgi:hypothetical protein